MNKTRISYFLLGLTGMLCLAGCSTTSVVTSWRDAGYVESGLKKPLVLAITDKEVIRFKIEDEFVRALQGMGVDAVQSYKMFPVLKGLNPDSIMAKLPGTGRDSILVTHLVDVKKETVHVPATTEVCPTGGGYAGPYWGPSDYNSFGSYYAQCYDVVNSPTYSYESKTYVLETNLYDAGTEKLVWTVTTDTKDPISLDSAMKDFVGVVMKDVQKNNLF
jgi:hypothetical protein